MNHYYPITIAAVGRELLCHDTTETKHIRWMCEQIESFDPFSLSAALKAARWIGWILAGVEQLGVWDNTVSREMVRADSLFGFDRPFQEKVAA